ncbi:sulfotransferase [Chloroflexi bacterium TSY]|nr:sulfotransferase [Chloroflexi bacterium TSY]
MLNKAPIFINGFQRSGTNILLNLIASHPDVCILDGETHQVFMGREKRPIRKWLNRICYIPLLLGTRRHLFGLKAQAPTLIPSKIMQRYIDFLFFANKLTAARENPQIGRGTNYLNRLRRARLLGKNVNGVVFATPLLAQMYPDATFIGMVRNGLALSEGFKRRGKDVDECGDLYQKVCQQMLSDAQSMDNYMIIRFEDLLQEPIKIVRHIYTLANLEMPTNLRVRLQSKLAMNPDGTRDYMLGASAPKELHWMELAEVTNLLRQEINANQIAQLNQEDKNRFLARARSAMQQFNYL